MCFVAALLLIYIQHMILSTSTKWFNSFFFFTLDLVSVDKLFLYMKLIEKIMLSVVFPCVI